jgi:NhaA family Na+:H+ antiporter
MATDIAFAVGVLALLGSRVPLALKVFVTAVAIVDDLGAVLVIALFYTAEIAWSALALAAIVFFALILANRLGIRSVLPYALLGIVLWFAFLKSGIHATIAGVLLAMTIPARQVATEQSQTPLARLEHALHPWVAFFIMPIFALANAGVALGGEIGATLTSSITLGLILGLFLGKQVGILAAAWISTRMGIAALPSGVSLRQIWGVSMLCGIGFTMSLFIAGLAFADAALLDSAKVGILAASLLSGAIGGLVLARSARVRADAESGPALVQSTKS